MSQPEWMLKFKQIGQKSQEEVTTVDESGIHKTGEGSQSFNLEKKNPQPTSAPIIPPWRKKKEPDVVLEDVSDQDAAAMFAMAAKQPAAIHVEEEEKVEEQKTEVEPQTGDIPPQEEEASASKSESEVLPTSSEAPDGEIVQETGEASASVEEEEIIEEEVVDEESVVGSLQEGSIVEESVVDESVVEESVVEESVAEETVEDSATEEQSGAEEKTGDSSVVEESVMSSSAAKSDDQSESVAADATQRTRNLPTEEEGTQSTQSPAQKISDEDFGEPWVPNRDQFIRDVNSTQFDEVEVERDTGNVHYEEVYYDENGNEIVMRRGGSEDDEEVLVDEHGNEFDEEYYTEEEMPRSANMFVDEADVALMPGKPSKDQPLASDEELPRDSQYDPAYDVENQIRLLQRGTKAYRSKMAFWVPPLFLLLCLAAGALFLYFVVFSDDDGVDLNNIPTASPTPKNFLPLNPTNTGAIDVASTTPMEPVSGSCSFRDVDQPHVIDQCSCTGAISVIAADVRERWERLNDSFMPTVIPDFNENIESCAATNQALVWLSSGVNNAGEAEYFVRRERFVLAYFYIQQGGTGWVDNGYWLSQLDSCMWDRVTCDSNGKVTKLDISGNDLIGQLSGAFTLLENLKTFAVAENDIVGTIPPEIFEMTSLTSLDISNNAFYGEIPDFSGNSSLASIYFQSNNLSGEIKASIANAKRLSVVDLSNNALNGNLPDELFELPLAELYLGPNFFSGVIPDAIGSATSLSLLSLGPNEFTGDIPTPIGQLINLLSLHIEDIPDLSGRLPASYGLGLSNLTEFVLTGTGVRGDIPDQFGSMTALEVMDFRQNSLQRQLPTTLGLLTNLRNLNLQENAFTGTIPDEIGGATSLTVIQMQLNELTGSIPSGIGNLQNLVTLELDGNFMEGRAPDEVCELRDTNLQKFTVDCPVRVNDAVTTGVICSIPSCCTECF